ncbi:MAG: glycerophosphodiester phosphodiesterase [Myxococcales bacterium]|nr:glycerophosphodiester phosphodiesterase [Myxococcales bacterium]
MLLRRSPLQAPLLLAHRGECSRACENTLEAFEAALLAGADGIELDVRRAGSGEAIVLHDADLRRVHGSPRRAAELSLERLREHRLGPGRARIPRLEEALELVLDHGACVNVELKDTPEDRAGLVEAVRVAIERLGAAEHVWFSSFHPQLLIRARLACPQIPRALLFDAAHTGPLRARALLAAARMGLLPLEGVHPHHPLCDPRFMRAQRRRGAFVIAWTVNDPAIARRLYAAGVDGLITDDIPSIRRAITLR